MHDLLSEVELDVWGMCNVYCPLSTTSPEVTVTNEMCRHALHDLISGEEPESGDVHAETTISNWCESVRVCYMYAECVCHILF